MPQRRPADATRPSQGCVLIAADKSTDTHARGRVTQWILIYRILQSKHTPGRLHACRWQVFLLGLFARVASVAQERINEHAAIQVINECVPLQ